MKKDSVGLLPGDALIIVDVQRDFLSGGALAVPAGDAIIPVLSRYIHLFASHKLPLIATRDWHTPDHCSFKAQGGPWPPHCVAETPGAAFAGELSLEEHALIISTAATADKDAYSAFEGTDLHGQLQFLGVRRLFIGGLATDYCVMHTVLDALSLDYKVFLLTDAIRAINVQPEDGDKAVSRMKTNGAIPIRLEQVA